MIPVLKNDYNDGVFFSDDQKSYGGLLYGGTVSGLDYYLQCSLYFFFSKYWELAALFHFVWWWWWLLDVQNSLKSSSDSLFFFVFLECRN